jgi:hypothetical protein
METRLEPLDEAPPPTGPAAHRRRHAILAALVVVLVSGAVLWWVTAPDALRDQGAIAAVPVALGEPIYNGHSHLATRPVTVVRLEPVLATDGLEVRVWVCDPVPGHDVIGLVGADDLAEYCRDPRPLVPGDTLEVHDGRPDPFPPYLLTELRATAPGPQVFCGFDVTYRDGWRTGRHREAGQFRIVLNPEPDERFGDDDRFPDDTSPAALCER